MGVLGGFSRSSDQELAILELWVLSFGCCRVAGPATFNGIGAENQRNHIKGTLRLQTKVAKRIQNL